VTSVQTAPAAVPSTPAASYLADFTAFTGELGADSPAWLSTARHQAIARFGALGFPTTKNEDWHYTPVTRIAEAGFRTLRDVTGDVRDAVLTDVTFGADWPTMVFVNGRHAPELSRLSGVSEGMRVLDLPTAVREWPELLQRSLTQIAGYQEHAFTALNTAFMLDGAVVHVGKEMEAERPLHLIFVSDATAARGTTHPRVLIVAERHSKATVIESYVSVGEATYFTNAVTEVDVADGATVNHYKIQRESPRAYHVGTIEARQGRDSHFVSFSFATGAALSRTNVYTVLGGDGCGVTLNGLYMVDGEQHVDHQTRVEHARPDCFSRELYKGVLDGASHGVFNGKVYVHPIAQKTDGKQSNNNLLLSDRAHIDTKPQLEIFADDVKCTHGATVGRLDATALFYMKSRGIPTETARKLLTYAFAADVLETIELDEVRVGLERLALERFAGTEPQG
jgi:Fe-S cluster assembly protein SufD